MGQYYTPPKMVAKNITDCLFDVSSDPSLYDFTATYERPSGEDQEFTIFTGEYFVEKLLSLYYNRKVIVRDDAPEQSLYTLFSGFTTNRNRAYAKMALAISENYDPLMNYDMRETMTNDQTVHQKGSTLTRTHTNTDTDTHTPFTKETSEFTPFTKETEELTPFTKETTELTPFTKETEELTPFTKETTELTPFTNETKTTTSPAAQGTPVTNTHSTKAFNDTNFVETEKDVRTGSESEVLTKAGKETTDKTYQGTQKVDKTYQGTEKTDKTYQGTQKVDKTYQGTQKTEKTYQGTEVHSIAHTGAITDANSGSDTDTRNYTLTRSGNIGTQTASDMIKKEFENLMINLADQAIDEFIDRYTFYAEGVI